MASVSVHAGLDRSTSGLFKPFAPKVPTRHHRTFMVPGPTPVTPRKEGSRLNRTEILRIIRFGVVGALGTLLNTLLVWLFLSFGYNHLGWHPADHTVVTAAATLSWILCCGTNYLLNALWTFRHWPPHWRQAIHYYTTALLSFVVQLLLLNLLVFLLDTERPIETAVLNGVAVATGALINYVAASLWVFSPNRHPLRRHSP
ncbi:MAG: GtrA family protein [Verrucomicrobia bacterium]|nr:GtrA family protein [Verrucomicrobiota bacterium]